MAQVEGVRNPVVALPDIHFKMSYHTPTGVVALAKDVIVPKFLNPNCGMSFLLTGIREEDLREERIDRIYRGIRDRISVSTRMEPVLSHSEVRSIVKKGASWAFERYGMESSCLRNFENRGSMFRGGDTDMDKVFRSIPSSSMSMGRLSLRVLGYGNHFIEMQVIDDIMDESAASLFGIEKGMVCFMMHGDSRAFGRSVCDHYSKGAEKFFGLQQLYKRAHYAVMASGKAPRLMKTALEKFNYAANRMKSALYWKLASEPGGENISFPVLRNGEEGFENYRNATYAAQNYGYANRVSMAAAISEALSGVLGGGLSHIRFLCDGNHDCLQEEEFEGQVYMAHRNGAARAFPSSSYGDHPVFSKTGQPVTLPSSLGNPSYLMAAGTGSREAYYSAPHGAGRLIDRGQAREEFDTEEVISEVRRRGMRIYDYGNGNAGEESPGAFKDIMGVVEAVRDNGIAYPVARLRPLAVLKGWT
jgi:tRNA-splicing ligase RtcB